MTQHTDPSHSCLCPPVVNNHIGASGAELKRILRGEALVQRLNGDVIEPLRKIGQALPSDLDPLLATIALSFNSSRKTRIALVGPSGSGKTKIVEFLIGEDILNSAAGGNATAVPGRFLFDVNTREQRYAEIEWETFEAFLNRHAPLLERRDLADKPFTRELFDHLRNIPFADDEAAEIEYFLRVADQHLRHQEESAQLPTEIPLTNQNAIDMLNDLTGENSSRNTSPDRVVDMVKEVRYHLDGNLEVEIVDCPGFGGGTLHDQRTQECIRQADYVMITVRGSRITAEEAHRIENLCETAMKSDGGARRHEKFFLVVNCVDDWDRQSGEAHVQRMVENLYGIDGPFPSIDDNGSGRAWLELSGQTALYAIMSNRGDVLSEAERNLFHGNIVKLGGNLQAPDINDVALEVSGGKAFLSWLYKASTHALKNRIQKGDEALSTILKKVHDHLKQEIATSHHGSEDAVLNEHLLISGRDQAHEAVLLFRKQQQAALLALRTTILRTDGERIVNEISESLQGKSESLWQAARAKDLDWRSAELFPVFLVRTFVSNVEKLAMELVSVKVPALVNPIVSHFYGCFQETELREQIILNAGFDQQVARELFSSEHIAELADELRRDMLGSASDFAEIVFNQPRFQFIDVPEEKRNAIGSGTPRLGGFRHSRHTGSGVRGQHFRGESLTVMVQKVVGELDEEAMSVTQKLQPFYATVREQFLTPMVEQVISLYLSRYQIALRSVNQKLNLKIEEIHRELRSDQRIVERIVEAAEPETAALKTRLKTCIRARDALETLIAAHASDDIKQE